MDVFATLNVLVGSVVVGVFGGLFGIGGGMFLVPFLVFAAGLTAKQAVAASLCCVIGTSASSSLIAARNGLARLDLSPNGVTTTVVAVVSACAPVGCCTSQSTSVVVVCGAVAER